MAKPIFVIVANGGALRAYREDETSPGKKTALQVVNGLDFTDAHSRYAERFSDQAGAFPVGRGGGATGIAERKGIQNESTARMVRLICDEIHRLLLEHNPEHWCLAAPPEVNNLILGRLNPSDRKKIARNLYVDLVKKSPAEVLERFLKA